MTALIKIHPTKAQVTYVFRTLEHIGVDYEKITELDRGAAAKLIGEIRATFNRHALQGTARYTEAEKQEAVNNRLKDLRKLKTQYAI